jgi:hypothetical protein
MTKVENNANPLCGIICLLLRLFLSFFISSFLRLSLLPCFLVVIFRFSSFTSHSSLLAYLPYFEKKIGDL